MFVEQRPSKKAGGGELWAGKENVGRVTIDASASWRRRRG